MSYNADRMWDAPRPPFGAFRGRTGEPYPPRWPHGYEPRMRGRGPLPFRGGAMLPGPPYASQGSLPYSYRDSGSSQEGSWEESRAGPQDQGAVPRRGASDVSYTKQSLTPDMDYRERDVVEQRTWSAPDVDYRAEEAPYIDYRVRLSPPATYRDRESLEHRRRLAAEGEAEHRKKQTDALNHRQREAADMDYNILLEALLKHREREECTDRALRDRQALTYRETAAFGFRDRETAASSFRERNADYTERAVHVRESSDLDLRVTSETDRALEYGESREQSARGIGSVTDVDDPEKDAAATDKGPAETSYRPVKAPHVTYEKEGPGAPIGGFQKATDADYREKECADSDYRDKESSDSDYRGRENADLNYRDAKTADSDYREKESADTDYREKESVDLDYREKESVDLDYREKESVDLDYREKESVDLDYREKESVDLDYREKESVDLDYRENADTDYRQSADDFTKESADKMQSRRDFSSTSVKEANKETAQGRPETDYPPIPAKMKAETAGLKDNIPFLAFSDEEMSSLNNLMAEFQSKSAAESPAPSCPGKLDTDFRDRAKERPGKPAGYASLGTPEQLCSGDQDLRTGSRVQEDEDLRGGGAKAPEDFFTQNSLLLDFLRLAAKELRDKTTGEEPSTVASPSPECSTSKTFPPDIIARPLGPESSLAPGMEYLCGEDTDYRNMDFNDVDLRVNHRPEKRVAEKRSCEEPLPGSKDKDYRRTPLPEGATKIIWLEGLPTGASREEILCALGGVHNLPEHGVNLIGYIPGYSLGSVCVEFSLVEEAVGCMEANKGVLHFKGKKVVLKYIPNSDRWTCLQCKAVNALSKERCWQCSALRAGSDHLSLRDSHKEPKTPPSLSTQRSKKRKSKRSPSSRSPDRWKEKSPPRERSPPPKTSKGSHQSECESATVIIRGIGVDTSTDSVVKALQPFAPLSPSNVRIMRNRKSTQRGFGFIDLKSHKEAIRLTVLVRDMKPPLTIDGRTISVDLAIGQRKSEQGKAVKGSKSSPGKIRKQRAQRKAFTYPGFRASSDEGSSYIYDPKTGSYVNPLTDAYYNEPKAEKRDDYPHSDPPPRDKKEAQSHTRRGFTEEMETDEEAFKKPLPPLVMKKEEPAEPKVNPLLGLIGVYVEDSEEEDEDEDEELLPPVQKNPPPPPPAPKPAPKAEPKPAPSMSEEDRLTDWKKMACLLCRRQFPSRDSLIRHQNLSDLHKQNIAIHEKIRKSQRELEFLQQREQEENQCIQRRLQQAKKELEMLEREEEGARQEAGEGLDTDVCTPEKRKAKGADTTSDPAGEKKRLKSSANQKPVGESYRENMKRLILERYKELE